MGKLKEVDNLGRFKYKGSSTKIFVEILVYEVDNLGYSKYKGSSTESFVEILVYEVDNSVDFHILPYIYIYKKKKLVLTESKRWACYTYPSRFRS